mmetsp:Transcript_75675/g.221867  ORF Transcript_75675/g.221867 Transcript_75675/m.221867 type:complete len:286 (-) Transcript_75675:465-1322(-)
MAGAHGLPARQVPVPRRLRGRARQVRARGPRGRGAGRREVRARSRRARARRHALPGRHLREGHHELGRPADGPGGGALQRQPLQDGRPDLPRLAAAPGAPRGPAGAAARERLPLAGQRRDDAVLRHDQQAVAHARDPDHVHGVRLRRRDAGPRRGRPAPRQPLPHPGRRLLGLARQQGEPGRRALGRGLQEPLREAGHVDGRHELRRARPGGQDFNRPPLQVQRLLHGADHQALGASAAAAARKRKGSERVGGQARAGCPLPLPAHAPGAARHARRGCQRLLLRR